MVENVTSGVVGFAPDKTVTFKNRPAEKLIGESPNENVGIVREVAGMLEQIDDDRSGRPCEKRLRTLDDGRFAELLVRAAAWRSSGGGIEGYVVTFDDVTQLVNAEVQAAWAEAARLVSHEVRNPLQGMVNSLYLIESGLENCAFDAQGGGAVIRTNLALIKSQVDNLVHLTTEFAAVGRMPEIALVRTDVTALLSDALAAQREQNAPICYMFNAPAEPVVAMVDPHYISSLVTNLLINARHAVAEQTALSARNGETYEPMIKLGLTLGDDWIFIETTDNGPGFPDGRDARENILRAGVTTRKDGSGLGLFIVRDAANKHRGNVEVGDAPVFEGCRHAGASVRVAIRHVAPPDDIAEPGSPEPLNG